ncbi:MAG: ACT domain-containing protein, partial [Actinomycetota bacterium]|nr:ACT domain-containing protein [Actinomycetota bacterium]
VEHGWRRVTFAGPLPWEQVGFLADVATRLAGAQIPFTSIAGFTTDHVLVRAAQAELAVAVLSGREPPLARPGTTNP